MAKDTRAEDSNGNGTSVFFSFLLNVLNENSNIENKFLYLQRETSVTGLKDSRTLLESAALKPTLYRHFPIEYRYYLIGIVDL